MISDEVALALHNKGTHGEVLSSEEQALLNHWYAAQDSDEQQFLGSAPASPETAELQSQVTASFERSIALAQRIRELSDHNDTLRREITQLHYQVGRLDYKS